MEPVAYPLVEPKTVVRTVVRRRIFEVRNMEDVAAVLARLKVERHTGSVIITLNMSQGGIREIQAEDKANI